MQSRGCDRARSRVADLFSSSFFPAPIIRASLILLVAGGATLLLTGCGPKRVRADFTQYENSYAVTSNHEELLNLARLQQHDPTYFFKLGQISSSYRMEASLSGAGNYTPLTNAAGAGNPSGGGTPGLIYENDPSFTLIPVNDDTNASILLKPVDSTVFYSLYLQGWRLDQLLRLTVSRIEFTVPTPTGCEVKVIRNLPPPWFDVGNHYQSDGFSLASYITFLRVNAVIYELQKHGLLLLRGTNTFVPVDQASFIPNPAGNADDQNKGQTPKANDPSAGTDANAQVNGSKIPVNVTVKITESQPTGGGDAASKNSSAPAAKDFNDAAAKSQEWQLQGADADGKGGKWVLGANGIQPKFVLTSHEQQKACQQWYACETVNRCDQEQAGKQDQDCPPVKACEQEPAGEPDPACEQVRVCRQMVQQGGDMGSLENNCGQEQLCERVSAYEQAKGADQIQACKQAQASQQVQAAPQVLSCHQIKECEQAKTSDQASNCDPAINDQVKACEQEKADKGSGSAYASEPAFYGQNVLDLEKMLVQDFQQDSGMKELLGPPDPNGQPQAGPDLREILEILYNGFSIEESSTDQNSDKELCAGGSDKGKLTDRMSARLVMRSLIGLMAAAAQEQQSFDALENDNPPLPNDTRELIEGFYQAVYQSTNPAHTGPSLGQITQRSTLFPKPDPSEEKLKFRDFVPKLEQLTVLKLTARKGDPPLSLRDAARLSGLGLEVNYRRRDFFIDDPEPDDSNDTSDSNEASSANQASDSSQLSGTITFPFVPDNHYWNRDMFRLINELSSQVSVDISKFPLPEVLQLRTE